jgi:hypothetical protein
MRLGEVLLQRGALEPGQLEDGLHAQAFFGARLGTNLVELEYIDLETLTAALAQQTGVPAARKEQFERIAPATLALVTPAVAEAHAAIPLGMAKGVDRVLVVAFRDPGDGDNVEALVHDAGCHVMPAVAPELRIYYYLEKHYGIPRKSRYLRMHSVHNPARPDTGEAAASPPVPERRRYAEPNPPLEGFDMPPVDLSPAFFEHERPPTVTVAQALTRIDAAASRDDIAAALCAYLRSRCDCALVLVVREAMALGWKGFAPAASATVVESLALPLGAPSMLRLAYDQAAPFAGPPPAEGAILQERLWKLLLCGRPSAVAVVPVMLRERVVNLIYAHGEIDVTALATLAQAASSGYARIIQQAKRSQNNT